MYAPLRKLIYEAERAQQILRFHQPSPLGGWPALLGISFPKSGTHLLDQILVGFSNVAPFAKRVHSFYAEYEGESGLKRDPADALRWLDSLDARDIASAHLFARPDTVSRVTGSKFSSFFIYRDPRDVVVSHVFYVRDMEARHVHHAYYASLPDFGARLKTSILGRPDAAVEFPDIAARFSPYTGWLDHSEVLSLRFEDFLLDRHDQLRRIATHVEARAPLGRPRAEVVDALNLAIDPKRSPTFRSGKTGEWRKHFSEVHKRIFKDVAGDLLIRLGYETGMDW